MIKLKKKIVIKICITILAFAFLTNTIIIIIDGLNDNYKKSDLMLVLGNKVNDDGRPSFRLQKRLDKAIELYNKQMAKKIIVSGGMSESGYSEAVVMKDYLVEHKIPTENIIIDEFGKNTYNSAKNTKKIMLESKYKSVIVVSHYYHITRAKFALYQFGIKTIYNASCDYYFAERDFLSVPRDVIALYAYLLKSYD